MAHSFLRLSKYMYPKPALLRRGRVKRFSHSLLEVSEAEEMVGIVDKFRFVYSAKHKVSIAPIEENHSLLFNPEIIRNESDNLKVSALNHIPGTNSCTDGSQAGVSDSSLTAGNMLLRCTNGLPFVDTKSYWNTCEKSLSTVYASEATSDMIPMDSKLLLQRCLAAITADHLIFCLVPTSQAHEKVVCESFKSFGMVDPNHFLILQTSMASTIQYWDIWQPFVPTCSTDQLFELADVLGVVEEAQPSSSISTRQKEEEEVVLESKDPHDNLVEDDGFRISKVLEEIKSERSSNSVPRFRLAIPKRMMVSMPSAPNDSLSSQPGEEFGIQARMASLDQAASVDSCIEWLLQDQSGAPSFLGLVCKYGPNFGPCLISLSSHQRTLLLPVPSRKPMKYPKMLRTVLSDENLVKVGPEIHKDALALFHFLGLVTNRCIKITHLSTGQKRKKGVLSIFRELFNWGWTEKKKVLMSDWGSQLSLEQIKSAVLSVWASRVVWARQSEMWKGDAPSFSLRNMPYELLNYFGRSVFSPELIVKKDKDTTVEMTGAKIEVHKHFLKLQQSHFKSRVLGLNSTVELRFKNGREPEKYLTMVRRGNKVVLDPDRSSESCNTSNCGSSKVPPEIDIDVSMISKVLVDNSDNADVQRKKLEDVLYFLLCTPPACPPHILVALGCSIESVGVKPKSFDLEKELLNACKDQLNSSQLNAWTHMLSKPLSAVIGPPGTGKTTLIKAVAKAWEHIGEAGETLLCVAHQNVAVRHMAESMVKEGIPGVLLLISEDYYVDWHEDHYTHVKDCIVISGPQTAAGMKTWAFRNKVTVPKVILCTLAVIGSQAFYTGLMGTKVTHLIIDECSQAAEGHLISNLVCLPHLQMLSVLGDPSQLPPYGKPLQSVFDLVAGQCDVKFLHQQFRMPNCIAKFVSEEFYQGRLETVSRKDCPNSRSSIKKPLMWVAVSGFPRQASGTKKSLCNIAEAEAIVSYCKEYKARMDEAGLELHHGKLIVLSLYEGQRIMVTKLLKENELEKIPVYNVDSFQGQEADDVLVSLVVGDRGSAFAVDRNRACVLLSRAKRLMYIFGDIESVKAATRRSAHSRVGVDNIWRSLANYCERSRWVACEADLPDMATANVKADAANVKAGVANAKANGANLEADADLRDDRQD